MLGPTITPQIETFLREQNINAQNMYSAVCERSVVAKWRAEGMALLSKALVSFSD